MECYLAFRVFRFVGVCCYTRHIIVILAIDIYHRLLFIVFQLSHYTILLLLFFSCRLCTASLVSCYVFSIVFSFFVLEFAILFLLE